MEPATAQTPFRARDSSPSPSVSPIPALLACPALDRSFSTASSAASTVSGDSYTSGSSSSSTASRRRGYVRPQGATFAESARNRDSVMSLGSIAHLQYYFARTGLLDGKGAQLAKARKDDGHGRSLNLPRRSASQPVYCNVANSLGGELVESPIDASVDEQGWDDQEQVMLPPTVSTYSHRIQHVPPPPDAEELRRDLRHALDRAKCALDETEGRASRPLARREGSDDGAVKTEDGESVIPSERAQAQGLHELQGIHLLDVVTLAIRSAKIYYTAHDHPERLTAIKSERKIREELLTVLDVLKRMASRNFAGGVKDEERTAITSWISEVEELLKREQEKEVLEERERESWPWVTGVWTGREREREWLFLNSFNVNLEPLPAWDDPSEVQKLPTEWLQGFQNGLRLVQLHNVLVNKSKRHFGDIKTFHTDTAKPYRCAENLRYWVKAAELRWETKLEVDVTGVVHGRNDDVWKTFDKAILTWCKAVREELTREWTDAVSKKTSVPDIAWVPPQLKFEIDE